MTKRIIAGIRPQNKNIIFAFALMMILLCFSACELTDKHQDDLPSNGQEEKTGTDGWNFSVNTTDLHGAEITNENFSQNKLTILNVWATWCAPCVGELPELQKISETFAEQGVQVVGVLQDGVTDLGVPDDKTIQNALKLLENANASYTVILPDETLMTNFISTMQYFPTTFFIDSEGSVIHTVTGARDFEDWCDEINEILKQIS